MRWEGLLAFSEKGHVENVGFFGSINNMYSQMVNTKKCVLMKLRDFFRNGRTLDFEMH